MKNLRDSWGVYGAGVVVAWVIVLLLFRSVKGPGEFHTILPVFGGFVIGWSSATIKHFLIMRHQRGAGRV